MSRWFIGLSLGILSWPVAPVLAQSTTFHGPISGFLYSHTSQSIRPLLGVPGAARIGAPLMDGLDFAAISPDGNRALITTNGHSSLLQGLAGLSPADSGTNGLIDAVDRVVWSRDGAFALLYSSSSNLLQRIAISGDTTTADPALDLSPWGQPAALAIDPAGRQIAFGVAGAGLYLFAAGQSPALISSMIQPAAAAFDDAGKRLYAVDLDQQQISEFDSGSSALAFASLTQPPGTAAVVPVGLAVSGDGHYLLLADSGAQAVQVYETSSGNLVNTIALDFTPSRFELLSPGPTFLLNGDHGNEWLLVLDARQTPGISFVPASQEVGQ